MCFVGFYFVIEIYCMVYNENWIHLWEFINLLAVVDSIDKVQ